MICIVGSESIFVTDTTKISNHIVVAVDTAHVKQTLLPKCVRSVFPIQEYQVSVDQAR